MTVIVTRSSSLPFQCLCWKAKALLLQPLFMQWWHLNPFFELRPFLTFLANLVYFSLGITTFFNFEIWPNKRYYLKQFVSATPLKPLTRTSWNFEVIRVYYVDMHFYRKCWFKEQFISLSNFGQNYFVQLRWKWFSVRLPITNAWNCHSLYTAFPSNVGAWGMWACSLFLSLRSSRLFKPLLRSLA